MGGGYYDRDVGTSSQSSGSSAYSASAQQALSRSQAAPEVSPLNRQLTCSHNSPIVVAMDVTGSMGDWSKIIYDKMPMFYGQIMMQGYLEDPAISFAAVGDAYTDAAPLQVCDFAQGTTLDEWLQRLWLEGGGGGQAHESYELAAYYYARRVTLEGAQHPFLFISGDEGFYDDLEARFVSSWIGEGERTKAQVVLDELGKKFHVFQVHKEYFGDDPTIVAQWSKAIGSRRVLRLEDPKAVVDVMLGVIAVVSGSRDLKGYLADMKERGQDKARLDLVSKVLADLPREMGAR
jgi:hypothetical protein